MFFFFFGTACYNLFPFHDLPSWSGTFPLSEKRVATDSEVSVGLGEGKQFLHLNNHPHHFPLFIFFLCTDETHTLKETSCGREKEMTISPLPKKADTPQ